MTLKPCPFCGDRNVHVDKTLRDGFQSEELDAYAYDVRCNSCAATGGWGKHAATAVHLWNTRATFFGEMLASIDSMEKQGSSAAMTDVLLEDNPEIEWLGYAWANGWLKEIADRRITQLERLLAEAEKKISVIEGVS